MNSKPNPKPKPVAKLAVICLPSGGKRCRTPNCRGDRMPNSYCCALCGFTMKAAFRGLQVEALMADRISGPIPGQADRILRQCEHLSGLVLAAHPNN